MNTSPQIIAAPTTTPNPINAAPIIADNSALLTLHPDDQPILLWPAPEYIKHTKGRLWFIFNGLLVLGIVVYGVITNSWTMSVAFLIFAGVYYLIHQEEPRQITIAISEMGIKIDTRFYPFSSIRYFWIVYNPPFVKTLHLKLASRTLSEIEVQLADQNSADVRSYLLKQIPEMEGKEESLTSIFSRIMKL